MNVSCPRCNSTDVQELNLSESSLKEYQCNGECADCTDAETHDHRYFQYETMDYTYSWPAVGVMYHAHAADLQQVRDGKLRPDFI